MSNPAGGPNNKPIQRISAQGGRVVREDNTVLNWADEMWLERYGVTLINGKPSGTSFGADFVVATEKAELAAKWEQGIPLKSITLDLQLTSRLLVTPDEVTLQLETGTDPAAFGYVYSNQRIRYEPGVPGYMKFTFAADPDNHNGDYDSAFGLIGPNSGYAIANRVVGGVSKLQFLLRNKGVDTYFDLNGDPFPEDQDVTNLNIYRIDYGFLGIDTTRLFVRDIANKKWVLLHEQAYPQRTTSINTPNLPVGALVRNNGNTANVMILNGSVQAGNIDGRLSTDPSARQKSYELTKSVGGATDGTVFGFRNDTTMEGYDSIDSAGATTTRIFPNTIASLLKKIKGTTDGAQNVVVSLYLTTIDNIISGTFTPVELGYSVLDVSEDVIVDLNAPETELLDSFPLTKVDSYRETVIAENNLLRPGQIAIFVYTTQAGTDLTWFISFEDLF
jgi:hypothetical protein